MAIARHLMVMVAVLGCSKKSEQKTERAPAPNPAPADAAGSPGCALDGPYRLHYGAGSTGAGWLRFTVAGTNVKLSGDLNGPGMDGPGATEAKADPQTCTITIEKKDAVAITLTVVGTNVTGTIRRGSAPGTDPIAGVRDAQPQAYPMCIKPGVYEVTVAGTAKWEMHGGKKVSKCSEVAKTTPIHVRVEMIGDELAIDNTADAAPYAYDQQGALVTKTADCEFDVMISNDVVSIKGHVVFAPDSFAGTGAEASLRLEDTTHAHEGSSCATSNGVIAAKRVGAL